MMERRGAKERMHARASAPLAVVIRQNVDCSPWASSFLTVSLSPNSKFGRCVFARRCVGHTSPVEIIQIKKQKSKILKANFVDSSLLHMWLLVSQLQRPKTLIRNEITSIT